MWLEFYSLPIKNSEASLLNVNPNEFVLDGLLPVLLTACGSSNGGQVTLIASQLVLSTSPWLPVESLIFHILYSAV